MASPARPSLREQQKLFTRQRLIDGALEVFATKGYASATVDDVVEAAGASRATFYLHFPSKLALVQAYVEELWPEVSAYYDALDAILVSGSREELREWVDDAVRWYEGHEMFATVMTEVALVEREEDLGVLGRAAELPDQMRKYFAKVPKRQRERARFRILLTIDHMSAAWTLYRKGDWAFDRDALVDELTDHWGRALGIL